MSNRTDCDISTGLCDHCGKNTLVTILCGDGSGHEECYHCGYDSRMGDDPPTDEDKPTIQQLTDYMDYLEREMIEVANYAPRHDKHYLQYQLLMSQWQEAETELIALKQTSGVSDVNSTSD